MAYAILNTHEYQGYSFNQTGDLAIVYEGPYAKAVAPHPLTAEIFQRVQEYRIGSRLASIHIVCPFKKQEGKDKYPLLALRRGWKRVKAELTFQPSVKRILLVSQSTLLTQVVMPGVKGLPDTHGTIFTLSTSLEVVPTFSKVYDYMRSWKDRDIDRWINLVKPAQPLPYETTLVYMHNEKHIIVDLETQGLDPLKHAITVLGVQWSANHRALITGDIAIALGIKKITAMVRNGTHVTFHNGQFDLGFMGQEFRDACTDMNAVHCTLIRSRARGELVGTLKHLGNLYTEGPGNYAWTIEGHKNNFDDPPYVTEDLNATWGLAEAFANEGDKPVVQQFEKTIVMAAEQSLIGSFIDKDRIEFLYIAGKQNIIDLEAECIAEYGIHPNKTQELVEYFLKQGHELTEKTPTGRFKLDADVCSEHGFATLLLHRKAIKLDSSFISKIWNLRRPDGTIGHTQSMLGAETGRSTMKEFNWQQAAKKGPVRDLLISRFPGGKIFIVDLAQAELRVLAFVSNDELFGQLFDAEDPHRANAARAFGIPEHLVTEDQRFDAKAVIFRVVYGGRATNAGQLRVEMYYKQRFVRAFTWIEFTKLLAQKQLFITDPYGKTRNLAKVYTWRGISGVGRAGINSPIQGVASHIALQVTYNAWRLFRQFKLQSKIIFGVHDSINADIHPDEFDIARLLIRLAFAQLRESHLFKVFPLAHKLPVLGELLEGESWGFIDKNKKSLSATMCSSLDPITIEECYTSIKKVSLMSLCEYF